MRSYTISMEVEASTVLDGALVRTFRMDLNAVPTFATEDGRHLRQKGEHIHGRMLASDQILAWYSHPPNKRKNGLKQGGCSDDDDDDDVDDDGEDVMMMSSSISSP